MVLSFLQPASHLRPYSSVPVRQAPYDHRSERAATEARAARKAGNPILVIRVGKVKPQALAAAFALEEFQLFFARDIEVREPAGVSLACETFRQRIAASCVRARAPNVRPCQVLGLYKAQLAAERGSPRLPYKHITVIDLDGFGMVHMGEKFRGPLQQVLGLLQLYYPEAAKHTYFVHAPFSFRAVFKLAFFWVDKNTQAATSIEGRGCAAGPGRPGPIPPIFVSNT